MLYWVSVLIGISLISACKDFDSSERQVYRTSSLSGSDKTSQDAGATVDPSGKGAINGPDKTATDQLPTPDKPKETDPVPQDQVVQFLTEQQALVHLPSGAQQLRALCARPGNDKVRRVFCKLNPPSITGLRDLLRALDLEVTDSTNPAIGPLFAFTGHSSSLVSRMTSSINPRAIIFSSVNNDPNFTAIGFVRGEQFVELVAKDAQSGELSFFLVKFKQACNPNCSIGELLTPAIERNWTEISIYEDDDLENTIFDCNQCHQPNGPNTTKMLRLQELQDPWTHWFDRNRPGGQVLLTDYQNAHGRLEEYAGIPGVLIENSNPQSLENAVRNNGFANQPNEFLSSIIEREVTASSPRQPNDNSVPGRSATWQALFNRAVNGEFIAVPYHDVKVTDPAKLQKMTQAYQAFVSGQTAAKNLTDIRDVFIDSKLDELGFGCPTSLNGMGLIRCACTQCHNSKLNQNISKAKFNTDLTKMDRAAKDKAISRLKLHLVDPADISKPISNQLFGAGVLQAMPPRHHKVLTKEQVELVIKELQK